MRKISVKIGVTAVFALALFALSISQASAQKFKDKTEGPVTLQVDCDAGQSIQAAVDGAGDGDTINVSGTCNERFTISKNRIKLIGLTGASIIGPDNSGDMIRVRGSNVLIDGFSTLTGDRRSILVERAGSAFIRNNIILGSGSTGIGVKESSSARIENNTIENSGTHGVRVTESSFARVVGNLIKNSVRKGVIVTQSGSAGIFDNTITENQVGIVMNTGGAGSIDNNIITDNDGDGIAIRNGSAVRLQRSASVSNPNTFERNGGTTGSGDVGLRCLGFSSIQLSVAQIFGTGVDANFAGDTSIREDCAASGPAAETVPDVVGFLKADAEAEIIGAGLAVGDITFETSGSVPLDNVISQDPAAGTITVDGSFFPVDLVVSGP